MTALPSSAWGCNITDGCDIPAPSSDIFFEYDTLFEIGFLKFDKPMILLLIAVVLVSGFFIFAFRKPTIVPRGTQNLAELAYNFIRDGKLTAGDFIGIGIQVTASRHHYLFCVTNRFLRRRILTMKTTRSTPESCLGLKSRSRSRRLWSRPPSTRGSKRAL